MNTKNINFDQKKSKKLNFTKIKKYFRQITKEPYDKNNSLIYFIGYNDNVIRPLCLRLPQMTGYAEKFNENVTMSFRVNNKQLLKNYNKIWEKLTS